MWWWILNVFVGFIKMHMCSSFDAFGFNVPATCVLESAGVKKEAMCDVKR